VEGLIDVVADPGGDEGLPVDLNDRAIGLSACSRLALESRYLVCVYEVGTHEERGCTSVNEGTGFDAVIVIMYLSRTYHVLGMT
jgi:hypothetical protein